MPKDRVSDFPAIPDDTILHVQHARRHLDLALIDIHEREPHRLEQNMTDAIDNLRWGIRALRKVIK